MLMAKWTETDQALFNTIARMKQPALLRSMKNYLKKYYPKNMVCVTEDYILVEGTIPVMLVAHMDTVFKSPPDKIYYDQKQHIMWSPQGLGADDRAGVYLIWKIVQAGYRPHICLTTDEEIGGFGAMALVKDFPDQPFDIKYIVELDRQGTNDCVFYSCANEKFQEFVEGYDFVSDWGTFSDISDICPAWKVAGVNLSVGYKGEHHETETLNTHAMMDTYRKVKKMLDDAKSENIPHFEYIADPYERYYFNLGKKYAQAYGWNFPYEDDDDDWVYGQKLNGYYPISKSATQHKCQCVKCHKIYDDDDVFPVKAKDHDGTYYYCLDCVGTGINWCKKCGEPFEVENETDELCPDCAGKKRPKTVIM